MNTPLIPQSINSRSTIQIFGKDRRGYLEMNGNLQIVNIKDGRMSFSSETETATLSPGDTLILNSYDKINYFAETECAVYSFAIDAQRFFGELCMPVLTRFKNFIFADRQISYICKDVDSEYRNQGVFHENMLNALTSRLIIHLYRHYNIQNIASPSASLLGRQKIARLAIEYIYENCQHGVTTSEISRKISVSVSYLCRCFKESTGVSVLEYAERIRCRKAKEDLSLGIYSVTQVSEKYGFNSLSYFNRRYKKYCGENPGETLAKAKKSRSRSV